MTTDPDQPRRRPDVPFLWGASTAAHQIEGNNIASDWWTREQRMPGMEPSGDAVDSYHRYTEDMRLLADAGLNAYRFSIEWARIEPEPGRFSRAELAHYRRMIDTAKGLGIEPVVTLHHFTTPAWFARNGGWHADDAVTRFRAYIERATSILGDVKFVATINEPNMLAMMVMLARAAAEGKLGQWQSPTTEDGMPTVLPAGDESTGNILVEAHHTARDVVRAETDAAVGWTVAGAALEALPGAEHRLESERWIREDLYLTAARDDDFIGVQSYSTMTLGPDGVVPTPDSPDNTLTGAAYRPDALGISARHAAEVTGLPVLVTENGIATSDDDRRIRYTDEALRGLFAAQSDGVDVLGYLHWSLLDNYEWGHWEPTFGLVSVDRETFERTPKPSLAWLGEVARNDGAEQRTTSPVVEPVETTAPTTEETR
ncbi:family 1 glycosylhydrolase [Nocardiopsis dassonvillei]|uniref:glycoside hydrolase family 1 protein n=1 Tax=Nocardiopsis dassonvillei TaxID=2014 RepID=UPI00200D6E3C|nr:family 1 glycosylhydrolase [Nocardiopsis dassonvillei]MCK9873491.1 family 1 glycosylhydrolase [Nocardiopsis dassonvillei]